MLTKSEIDQLAKATVAEMGDIFYDYEQAPQGNNHPVTVAEEAVVKGIEQALATTPTVTPRMLESANVILGVLSDTDIVSFDTLKDMRDIFKVLYRLPVVDPKPYTVLLVLPDYLADNYGQETYLVQVDAVNVKEAVAEARREAVSELNATLDTDFFVSFVCEGHVDDIKEVKAATK